MAINGLVPGPLIRLQEGDDVTLRVTNRLKESTSIHWHGLLVPADMDGVPGVSFAGISRSIRPGCRWVSLIESEQNCPGLKDSALHAPQQG